MTYRELLKLYQEGKLDEEQKQEVEQSVEKQEAISEYLYERKRKSRDWKHCMRKRRQMP